MIKRYGPYRLKTGHLFYTDYNTETKKSKTVLVHREMMEQHLGRKLQDDEIVHHKDHDPGNNVIYNFELKSPEQHASDHAKERGEVLPIKFKCLFCGSEAHARYERELKRNQTLRGCNGPFCDKSCAARWQFQTFGTMNGKAIGQIKHGTPSAYNYGKCRCVDCTEAHRLENQRHRQHKIFGPLAQRQRQST